MTPAIRRGSWRNEHGISSRQGQRTGQTFKRFNCNRSANGQRGQVAQTLAVGPLCRLVAARGPSLDCGWLPQPRTMASLASGDETGGPLMESLPWEEDLHEKLEALYEDHEEWRVPFEATRLLKGYFPNCSVAIEWLEGFEEQDTFLINGVVTVWDTVVVPKVSLDWFLRAIPDDWAHPLLELPQKRGYTRRLAGLAHKLQAHNGDKEFPLHQPALAEVLSVSQQAVSMALTHLVNIGWLTRPPEKRKDAPKCSYGRWLYRCPHP